MALDAVSPFGWGLFVVLLLLGAWSFAGWLVGLFQSACQLILFRSALADRESSRHSSLPGEGGHDRPLTMSRTALPSSVCTSLSSSARAVVRRFDPPLLALPVAAIDPAPAFDAFGAGVELMVFTALFTIGALLVVNWIIRAMRSSNN